MSETYEVAPDGTPERLIQRLENATPGNLFYCEADREEAVEIAQEEFATAISAAEARGRAAGLKEAAKAVGHLADEARHDWASAQTSAAANEHAERERALDKAVSEIRALAATPPELTKAETAWQRMESAPKDGREVDLLKAGGRFCGYFWDAEQRGSGAWSKVSDRHRHWRDRQSIFAPTHWMPSPEPPALDVADRTEGGRDGQ
jgi:hypothetical protein